MSSKYKSFLKNIMSYDKKSIQKTFDINKQIAKIMKILKKYTFIKDEKKLLLAELKKIADRKNEPNRHKISSNRYPAYRDWETDRKSTRLNSSHRSLSRMPSSA